MDGRAWNILPAQPLPAQLKPEWGERGERIGEREKEKEGLTQKWPNQRSTGNKKIGMTANKASSETQGVKEGRGGEGKGKRRKRTPWAIYYPFLVLKAKININRLCNVNKVQMTKISDSFQLSLWYSDSHSAISCGKFLKNILFHQGLCNCSVCFSL